MMMDQWTWYRLSEPVASLIFHSGLKIRKKYTILFSFVSKAKINFFLNRSDPAEWRNFFLIYDFRLCTYITIFFGPVYFSNKAGIKSAALVASRRSSLKNKSQISHVPHEISNLLDQLDAYHGFIFSNGFLKKYYSFL